MFTRIHIKGFRTCHDVQLDNLGQITALIGKNGSGKTNILKAIEWAAATAIGGEAALRIANASVDFEVLVGAANYRYAFTLDWKDNPNSVHGVTTPKIEVHESLAVGNGSRWTELLTRAGQTITVEYAGSSTDLRAPTFTPMIQVFTAVSSLEDPVFQRIQPFLSFLRGVRYYPLDEPTDTARMPASPFIDERDYAAWAVQHVEQGTAPDDIQMQLLFMWKKQPEKFKEFVSLAGPNGLNLIQDVKIFRSKSRRGIAPELPAQLDINTIVFRPPDSSAERDYAQLSAGTRRVLRMILSMVFDESSVMLIEQPEDSIHTGLLKKIIPLLRDFASCQVIMASHSPTVMNLLRPEELRLVTIKAGKTSVRALTPRETKTAEKYISEEGVLADFVRVVEGA